MMAQATYMRTSAYATGTTDAPATVTLAIVFAHGHEMSNRFLFLGPTDPPPILSQRKASDEAYEDNAGDHKGPGPDEGCLGGARGPRTALGVGGRRDARGVRRWRFHAQDGGGRRFGRGGVEGKGIIGEVGRLVGREGCRHDRGPLVEPRRDHMGLQGRGPGNGRKSASWPSCSVSSFS